MGIRLRGIKFGSIILILQVVFIILIGVLADYHSTDHIQTSSYPYPNFQDVNVMIFIGFGFLMTFLKNYGFSSVGVNLLIAVVCIQWSFIVRGFIHADVLGGDGFKLGVPEMVTSNFATATVLISFGAVLGKASPSQLIIMGIIEVILAQINEYIGVDLLHTKDVGESMFIHMFGAYFGLAVARVLYNPDVEESSKEGSVYHSDLFAMVGTVFLWIYWPSFNGGFDPVYKERAYLNTFLSLCACTAVTFAVSAMLDKRGRFDMVHIQNSTLAGGVAVGASANMPMKPFGSMIFGAVAGLISVLGYKFLSPKMAKSLRIHDTCGVHNLHGMPGVLAAIGAAVLAALSDNWSKSDQYGIFPETLPKRIVNETGNLTVLGGMGRSALEQGGYQIAAAFITLAFAIVGGVITGFIMKLPIWDAPKEDSLFDDVDNWELPEEGVPGAVRPNHYKVSEGNPESPM